MHQSASSVGAIMLQAYTNTEEVLKNEILYLIGADEINIDTKINLLFTKELMVVKMQKLQMLFCQELLIQRKMDCM
ncbi:MAG: hypothetical protein FF85_01845 [alpha proteobacterium QL1]|nr:MAG: hypothetical protein FF85_01845 [alpha proteobacterium QL1]